MDVKFEIKVKGDSVKLNKLLYNLRLYKNELAKRTLLECSTIYFLAFVIEKFVYKN